MARFYRPGVSQYTSQFVPLPLDFMYGALQEKQGKFDQAKQDVAETQDALLINSIYGRKFKAKEMEDTYSSEVEKLTDKLIAEGDIESVSLDLNKIKRRWDKDPIRRQLEEEYVRWGEIQKEWDKVKDKRDYNHPLYEYIKTVDDLGGKAIDEQGNLIPFIPGDIYEGQNHLEGMQKALDKGAASSNAWKGAQIDWGNGVVIKQDGSSEAITPDMIWNWTNQAINAGALNSDWGQDLLRMYKSRGITGNDNILNAISEDMYNANLQRAFTKTSNGLDYGFVPAGLRTENKELAEPLFPGKTRPTVISKEDYIEEASDAREVAVTLETLLDSKNKNSYQNEQGWEVVISDPSLDIEIENKRSNLSHKLGKLGIDQIFYDKMTVSYGLTPTQVIDMWANQQYNEDRFYYNKDYEIGKQSESELLKDIYSTVETDEVTGRIKEVDEDGNVVETDVSNLKQFMRDNKGNIKLKVHPQSGTITMFSPDKTLQIPQDYSKETVSPALDIMKNINDAYFGTAVSKSFQEENNFVEYNTPEGKSEYGLKSYSVLKTPVMQGDGTYKLQSKLIEGILTGLDKDGNPLFTNVKEITIEEFNQNQLTKISTGSIDRNEYKVNKISL